MLYRYNITMNIKNKISMSWNVYSERALCEGGRTRMEECTGGRKRIKECKEKNGRAYHVKKYLSETKNKLLY